MKKVLLIISLFFIFLPIKVYGAESNYFYCEDKNGDVYEYSGKKNLFGVIKKKCPKDLKKVSKKKLMILMEEQITETRPLTSANQAKPNTLEKKYFDMVYFCIEFPNYISGPYIAVDGQCVANMDVNSYRYILEDNEFEGDFYDKRFASDTKEYDTFLNVFCNELDNLKSKEEQIRFSSYKDYLCDKDNAQKKIIDQNKSERAEEDKRIAEAKKKEEEAIQAQDNSLEPISKPEF